MEYFCSDAIENRIQIIIKCDSCDLSFLSDTLLNAGLQERIDFCPIYHSSHLNMLQRISGTNLKWH